MESEKPSLKDKLKNYVTECRRVLTVTKKPTKMEFSAIVKVTSLGILLIGAIGFLIQLINIFFEF